MSSYPLCCVLWPLGLCPAPSPGTLSSYISLCSQPQVCLSAAFGFELHWWAVSYITLSFISTVVIRFLLVVFEFSATFEVGGERKRTNLHQWSMLKKNSCLWHVVKTGWLQGVGVVGFWVQATTSPCVLKWKKGLGTSCYRCLVAQWCPTLCDPMDCSPPGSSVHGISQARVPGVSCHFLFHWGPLWSLFFWGIFFIEC